MKKNIIITGLLVLAMMLSACESQSGTTGTDGETVEMNMETELLVGILELDGTENEVDAEQAPTLLPLWQMYQSLLTGSTAAQEEVDAVIEQIQETMTSNQLEAIDAMDLQPEDVMSVMKDLGLAMGPGEDGMSATPDFSMMPEGFSGGEPPEFSGGGPPSSFSGGGAVPGGGSAPGGGGGFVVEGDGTGSGLGSGFSEGMSGTPGTWQSGLREGRSVFTMGLVRVVIEYLEGIIQP